MDPPLHNESKAYPTIRQKRDSPEPSFVSMRSDTSKDLPFALFRDDSNCEHKRKRDSSEPSCVSMRSDTSKDLPFALFKHDSDCEHKQKSSDSPEPSCVSISSDMSRDLPFALFKAASDSQHRQKTPYSPESSHVSVKSATSKDTPCADFKVGNTSDHSVEFKTKLRKAFQHLHEGIPKQGNPRLFNEIYTELCITEDENEQNETEAKPISCNNIFKPLPGQDQSIRTVLTKGVAGIGKTVSVQKFILDWAEGEANQDVHLIFPLPFRELNLIKDQTFSLKDLLKIFINTELEISQNECKILFIFDGLDECRLSLDFQKNVRLSDVTKSASVDVLLTNLIMGNLLPSALIWITSRPAAADRIPSEFVHRVTEVRGFSDPQKEEYFRKRITDETLANKIISHLKSSRSLYIMCHIPVFCWISATVLEKMLSEAESGEIPKTLTQMYTHFLILQTNIKHEKDYETKVNDEDMILKLGKLAFQQLIEGNLIFYEEDLKECGIDVSEASVYSGLCTSRQDLLQRKMYCFVHLTIQEHLAALFVHHSFVKNNINVFNEIPEPTNEAKNEKTVIFDLHQKAVDKAINSKTGHLDLFLRFLLGFSVVSNQTLLKGLLAQTVSRYHNLEATVKYIKKKIEEHPTPEKFINLFHCLSDLGDHSLIDYIMLYIDNKSFTTLSSLQWSAVIFVLLTSENLGVFRLKYFASVSDSAHMLQILLKLLPVIEASTSIQLSECGLTEQSCVPLARAISTEASCVLELNMSGNTLKDKGVQFISEGLMNPHCKLEILRLRNCDITEKGCAYLTSALTSNSLQLRELDLSENELEDSGVKLCCAVIENTHCKLETLTLNDCRVKDEGCAALASALTKNPQLKVLNLSKNNFGDSGVKLLSVGLADTRCKLEKLRLELCLITDEGCTALSKALNLKALDLSGNKLGDSGLSAILNPQSNLEELWFGDCDITDEGCDSLASALTSNSSNLRELNLSFNKIGDSGVKKLSAALADPHCKLENLRLGDCGLTDESCAHLALALSVKSSCMRSMDLSNNAFGDKGIKLLFSEIKTSCSKLEALWLNHCALTDEGCAALAEVLTSNFSHLKKLHLCDEKLGETGVEHLCVALDNPVSELQTLRFGGLAARCPFILHINMDRKLKE